MPILFVAGTLLLGASAADPPQELFGEDFKQHWFDGRAEVALYELERDRYGQPREGRLEMITVSETFDLARRVKTSASSGPTVGVLKLNLLQQFQTGIYEYRTMSSGFSALEDWPHGEAGSPVKLHFNSQEWCGALHHQVAFDRDAIRSESHSYFEGEADDDTTLERPGGALSEDLLILWARGLAAPAVAPGAELERPILRSLERVRLDHRPLAFETASFRRAPSTRAVQVPAGEFVVREALVEIGGADARRWRFLVEEAFPHRPVQIEGPHQMRARLTGVERLAYWNRTRNSDAARREALEGRQGR